MWACDRCGRQFVNTNQTHACQQTTDIEHLAGKTVHSVRIYRAIVESLQRVGVFRVHAQKTRIAFTSKMTFASVRLARRWVTLDLILPEPLDSPRVRRLDQYGPSAWGHAVRLSRVRDVDSEVEAWLAEALRRGDREPLDSVREVTPLNMRQLSKYSVSFRGHVTDGHVELPRHVSAALAATDEVLVRVQGEERAVSIERGGSTGSVPVGLEDGVGIDVTIKGLG